MNSKSQPTARNCTEKLTVATLKGLLDSLPPELDNMPIMDNDPDTTESFTLNTSQQWSIGQDSDQPTVILPIQ